MQDNVRKIFSQIAEEHKRVQPSLSKLLPRAGKKYGLLSETLQVRGAVALATIYTNGIHLDRNRLEPVRQELRSELFRIAEELEKSATLPLLRRYKQQRYITPENRGYRLNGSGYPQVVQDNVRKIFSQIAEEHKFKPPKSVTGKLSITKEFWTDYRDLSAVVDLFLELQSRGKLYGFFANLGGDHVHPQYNPIVRSGRVSCQGPNLQQMPRSGNVREMFVPRPGYALFAIDYSALELRTLAAVCLQKYGESQLADIINSGTDPHAYSYCKIHGMTLEEFAAWKKREPQQAKAARDAIKGVTFGIPGSMQPPGLVSYVKKSYGQKITEETAAEYMDNLVNKVYPEWKRYLKQTGSRVHTLTGRVRGRIKRSGQLFNTQFQGLAGDGAKEALWRLMRAGYRIVGFVHDEFLLELPADQDNTQTAKEVKRICCETMAEFTPGVQIDAEYALSDCWSKQAEAVYDEDGKLIPWEDLGKETLEVQHHTA